MKKLFDKCLQNRNGLGVFDFIKRMKVSLKASGFKGFEALKLGEFPSVEALVTPTNVRLAINKGRPYPLRGKSHFYFA